MMALLAFCCPSQMLMHMLEKPRFLRGTLNFLSPLRTAVSHVPQGPRFAARGLIALYRYTFSALAGFHCRHLPTCSCYADEAIGRFGLWAGGWMTLARLCRCQPWGTAGIDAVPPTLPAESRWYLPWRF